MRRQWLGGTMEEVLEQLLREASHSRYAQLRQDCTEAKGKEPLLLSNFSFFTIFSLPHPVAYMIKR